MAENCNVFNITENGKLTLINLTISNGKTAIYNKGTLCLLNCNFINNKGVDGGAIYNMGKLIITKSTFSNNIVSHCGGAIYNIGDNTIVNNCKFLSNTAKAKTTDVEGGAIYNEGNNLQVDNCLFNSNGCINTDWFVNGAVNGAGIANKGENIIVLNSLFTRNYLQGSTDTTAYHIDLREKYGGGVYTIGTATVINNTFDYNEIYSLLASYIYEKVDCSNRGYGAGIYVGATSNVINNTFINNKAGRAPIFIKASNCSIEGNTFYNNTVRHDAPVIEIWEGENTTIRSNKILQNHVINKNTESPAIHIWHGKNEVIENNYFEKSSGIYYYNVHYKFVPDAGTGHYDYDYVPANVVIRNNIFKESNEGIYLDSGVGITIEGNQFYDCHSGIMASNSRDVVVKNNYFTGELSQAKENHGYYHKTAPSCVEIYGADNVISENIFAGLSGAGTIVKVDAGDKGSNTITGNYFVNNNILNNYTHGDTTKFDNAIIEASAYKGTDISDNYFANNNLNGGSIFHLSSFYGRVLNNVFYANDASSFIFEDYYKYNDFALKNNKFSDIKILENGQVWHVKDGYVSEHPLSDIVGTVINQVGNGIYDGDGSEFNKKMKELLDFILNGLKKPSDSNSQKPAESDSNNKDNSTSNTDKPNENIKDPNKNPTNEETDNADGQTNSSHDLDKLPDFDGDDLSEKNSNKTSDSNVGDYIFELVHSAEKVVSTAMNVENGAFISKDSTSRSVGTESSENPTDQSKSYEINKNLVKSVNDDSMFLKMFTVVIIVLALIGVGYYRKR